MWKDEIVEEVRKAREEHAQAHGNDLRRIYEDLRAKQDASGRRVVSFEQRRPTKAE